MQQQLISFHDDYSLIIIGFLFQKIYQSLHWSGAELKCMAAGEIELRTCNLFCHL